MALFVSRHEHAAETCPARDPKMGGMLLTHLSASSASKHGVTIHGEGVIENQHTFYLIAEAENKEKMEEFLQPFAQAGTVEVWPANHCEAVVQRAGC